MEKPRKYSIEFLNSLKDSPLALVCPPNFPTRYLTHEGRLDPVKYYGHKNNGAETNLLNKRKNIVGNRNNKKANSPSSANSSFDCPTKLHNDVDNPGKKILELLQQNEKIKQQNQEEEIVFGTTTNQPQHHALEELSDALRKLILSPRSVNNSPSTPSSSLLRNPAVPTLSPNQTTSSSSSPLFNLNRSPKPDRSSFYRLLNMLESQQQEQLNSSNSNKIDQIPTAEASNSMKSVGDNQKKADHHYNCQENDQEEEREVDVENVEDIQRVDHILSRSTTSALIAAKLALLRQHQSILLANHPFFAMPWTTRSTMGAGSSSASLSSSSATSSISPQLLQLYLLNQAVQASGILHSPRTPFSP